MEMQISQVDDANEIFDIGSCVRRSDVEASFMFVQSIKKDIILIRYGNAILRMG